MARQHRFWERFRSIAGGALVALPLHILFANLDRVATQLRHPLGTTAGEALGILPSVLLATSHAVQDYALDHQAFLQGLLRALVSLWPLLLVLVGATLLQDAFTDKVKAIADSNQNFQNKQYGMSISPPLVRRIDRAQVHPVGIVRKTRLPTHN